MLRQLAILAVALDLDAFLGGRKEVFAVDRPLRICNDLLCLLDLLRWRSKRIKMASSFIIHRPNLERLGNSNVPASTSNSISAACPVGSAILQASSSILFKLCLSAMVCDANCTVAKTTVEKNSKPTPPASFWWSGGAGRNIALIRGLLQVPVHKESPALLSRARAYGSARLPSRKFDWWPGRQKVGHNVRCASLQLKSRACAYD